MPEGVWGRRYDEPCTLGRSWDFVPETIMRDTLCAFDIFEPYPIQGTTYPSIHPMHIYVRSNDIGAFDAMDAAGTPGHGDVARFA